MREKFLSSFSLSELSLALLSLYVAFELFMGINDPLQQKGLTFDSKKSRFYWVLRGASSSIKAHQQQSQAEHTPVRKYQQSKDSYSYS